MSSPIRTPKKPPYRVAVVPPALSPWDGTIIHARALQREVAARVRLIDEAVAPRTVAGVDVGFEDGGAVTRAAAVLLDAASQRPIAQAVVRQPTHMIYVPGLLSFRELPALVKALAALPQVPDLVMVDGHGIAHPRRLGIAAHLGVASGLATVGVAKSILIGAHAPLGGDAGDTVPLVDAGERIGTVLRSKRGCRPLIVSPGHRVSHDGAVDHVRRWLTRYRLPEPTRLADRLASRRDG